jgi:hypothetical protein
LRQGTRLAGLALSLSACVGPALGADAPPPPSALLPEGAVIFVETESIKGFLEAWDGFAQAAGPPISLIDLRAALAQRYGDPDMKGIDEDRPAGLAMVRSDGSRGLDFLLFVPIDDGQAFQEAASRGGLAGLPRREVAGFAVIGRDRALVASVERPGGSSSPNHRYLKRGLVNFWIRPERVTPQDIERYLVLEPKRTEAGEALRGVIVRIVQSWVVDFERFEGSFDMRFLEKMRPARLKDVERLPARWIAAGFKFDPGSFGPSIERFAELLTPPPEPEDEGEPGTPRPPLLGPDLKAMVDAVAAGSGEGSIGWLAPRPTSPELVFVGSISIGRHQDARRALMALLNTYKTTAAVQFNPKVEPGAGTVGGVVFSRISLDLTPVDQAAASLELYDRSPRLEIACLKDRIVWAAGGASTHEVFTTLVDNFRKGRRDLGLRPGWKNAVSGLPAKTNFIGGASVAETLRIAGLAGGTRFGEHLARMAATPVERPGGAGASMVLGSRGVTITISVPIEAVSHTSTIGFRAAVEAAKEGKGAAGLADWLGF